jgi:type IV secretory pathway component VirB8
MLSIAKVKILSTQTAVGANKVTVVFAKGIFNEFEELQSSSKWKADIEFYLSNYDFSKATDANLDFIVTKYTVNKIETP